MDNEQLGKTKKILLVAPQPFYQDRGTPIALKHLMASLSQHNFSVDVLTYPLGSSPEIKNIHYFRTGNPLRFKQIPIGFSLRKIFLDILLFFKLRKILKENHYDLLHAVEEAAFLVCFLNRKNKIPFIYDMQSNMAEQLAAHPVLGFKLLRPIWKQCEDWLIRHSSVIACSSGLKDYVISVDPNADVHEWRYPNQTTSCREQDVEKLREKLSIPRNAPVVVYTGTFEAYQGLEILTGAACKVVLQFPETVFVFVGGNNLSITKLENDLKGKVAEKNYRLMSRQPSKYMNTYFGMADILVSPRAFGENLPLKILEYMASSRAIVATDIKAHQSILSLETAVLSESTPEAFSKGIKTLLKDPELRAEYARKAFAFHQKNLGWDNFHRTTYDLVVSAFTKNGYPHKSGEERQTASLQIKSISVIIPARNEEPRIARLINTVQAQQKENVALEIIVVNDNSTDGTSNAATQAGARVVNVTNKTGNPAHARNIGAREAKGDLLIFLDADCIPEEGWLDTLLQVYKNGWRCVGGSLKPPKNISFFSELDYYCGWYHAHERQPSHIVYQHPPCNLSVEKDLFMQTSGFTETQPIAYAHEELAWQQELKDMNIPIYFEAKAMAAHHNREGFANVLRRNYRWANSAVESKYAAQNVRMAWLYKYPWLAALLALPLIPIHTLYIIFCWLKAGVWKPLFMSPFILMARIAYGVGMFVGTLQWLALRKTSKERRSLWE